MRAFLLRCMEPAAIVAFAAMLFVFSAQIDLLEKFRQFAHDHEEWVPDGVFSVFIPAAFVWLLVLYRSNKRLGRALSSRIEAEKRARHISHHDALTGLYNRRKFFEALNHNIENATLDARPGIILIDLDRFKPINDLRGHEAGDKLLGMVGARLRETCPADVLVSRLGGDEFALVMPPPAKANSAAHLARRISDALGRPHQIDDWVARLGCSIGIALWKPGMNAAELLRNADQAMYRAKDEGRGRYGFYDEALGASLRERAALEAELRLAIENQMIAPHFQPIYDLKSGELAGFEVLARWIDPIRGPVSPEIFIPIAEDLGLSEEITLQVFRRACECAATWPDSLFCALNISPQQLLDKIFPTKLVAILAETGVRRNQLEIELTETAIAEDIDGASHMIADLRSQGMRVALDDFGTGHSSLSLLASLPFDRLKIDRSFVAGIDSNEFNKKIVSGALALAEALGLEVTAEGIETAAELDFLVDKAPMLGQGYHLNHPMPAENVADMLWSMKVSEPEEQHLEPRDAG